MKKRRFVARWLGRCGPRSLPWAVVDTQDGQVLKNGLGAEEALELAQECNYMMACPWWKRIGWQLPRQVFKDRPGQHAVVAFDRNTYRKHFRQEQKGGER